MIHGISKTFKLEKLRNVVREYEALTLCEAPVPSFEARHYLCMTWDAP